MRLGGFQRGGEGVRLDEAEFQRLLSLERLGEQEKLGRLGAPRSAAAQAARSRPQARGQD